MNYRRVFPLILVIALVSLILAAVPAASAPVEVSEEQIDVKNATLDIKGDEAVVRVEYSTSLSLKLGTLLFGSDSLEESITDVLSFESVEFRELSPDSAVVVVKGDLDGRHEFGQTIEHVAVEGANHYSARSVYLG